MTILPGKSIEGCGTMKNRFDELDRKKIQSQSANVVDQLAKPYLHVEHHRSQK